MHRVSCGKLSTAVGTKVSNPEPAQIGRRFLVTGASGFLGTHFCRRLVNLGAEVHAVSRTERPSAGGLRWWRGNLLSRQKNMYLLQAIRPDVIVHLSGRVTAAHHVEEVLSTFESLLATTVNLLTAVAHWGAQPRVVLVGSLTEPPPGPDECTPGSPYVAAKWAASAYGRMFHALYETPVVIARPGMVYGPGQDPRKLIPYVMRYSPLWRSAAVVQRSVVRQIGPTSMTWLMGSLPRRVCPVSKA